MTSVNFFCHYIYKRLPPQHTQTHTNTHTHTHMQPTTHPKIHLNQHCIISDRGVRGFAAFLKIQHKRWMSGICRAKLHYTFVYAHALSSLTDSFFCFFFPFCFATFTLRLLSVCVLWVFLSKVDWLCLIVCFVRRDMFQTNTWIRERRDTL